MSEQSATTIGQRFFFREAHFFESFHGHIFSFTGTVLNVSTGTFAWFTGSFFVALGSGSFWSSRARSFHGSRPLLKFTGTFFPVHGYFLTVHGHIFVNCSRAEKNINGQFLKNVHGQKKYSRAFFSKSSRAYFQFSRGKNTVISWGREDGSERKFK